MAMFTEPDPMSNKHEVSVLETEEEEALDVLDLPQLYQKPPATTLLATLDDLASAPLSWETAPLSKTAPRRRKIKSEGVPAYLTRIISSPLHWIEDDGEQEKIWELAAQRLSERSGRSAMGDITRTFTIPIPSNEDKDGSIDITLHEPALQGDNLGLKTWAASFLLSKRLPHLRSNVLPPLPPDVQVLELGSGTGLVGLAASAVFKPNRVLLSDLPEIVSNLERNIHLNINVASTASAAILDWSSPALPETPSKSFPLILAADPIYSPSHPELVVQAIRHHLCPSPNARVVIELPLREAYVPERKHLRERLEGMGLRCLEEGEEVGVDDWRSGGVGEGEAVQVRCWWSVWGWK